jgi:pimeloyl-ACP methyl ester carboxylesterase
VRVDVDGSTVFVHTGGVALRSDRPAVLLLHGAAMDHSVWRYVSRALAHDGHAVIAPDLPGHGLSGGPALPDVPAMAAWAAALLDALELGTVSVVGHSMGSLIAVELAASRPERVAAVVLVATAGRMTVHPDLQDAADSSDPVAVELLVGWSHSGDARLGGHSQPGTWNRSITARLCERNLGVLGCDLRACASYPAADRAAAVSAPTLVLAGTEDRMTPIREAEIVADAIPEATILREEGAGHMLLTEDPAFVLSRIRAFLRGGR